MQCGRRRRLNCRSHMNKPSKEGAGREEGAGPLNAAKRQRQRRTAWTQQDGDLKGQHGINLGMNYKLQWFKKEWEEEKSRENNNLLQKGTENGLRGKEVKKGFLFIF